MVKLQVTKNGKSCFITIPKDIVDDSKLKAGDRFKVTTTADKETIMFTKIKV
jgi:antitoxin component of MazEF toxin-antitoxin module